MGTRLQYHLVFESKAQSALDGLFDLGDQFVDLDLGRTHRLARLAPEARIVVEFERGAQAHTTFNKLSGKPNSPPGDHGFAARYPVRGADSGAPTAPDATVGLKIEINQSQVCVQHGPPLKRLSPGSGCCEGQIPS